MNFELTRIPHLGGYKSEVAKFSADSYELFLDSILDLTYGYAWRSVTNCRFYLDLITERFSSSKETFTYFVGTFTFDQGAEFIRLRAKTW